MLQTSSHRLAVLLLGLFMFTGALAGEQTSEKPMSRVPSLIYLQFLNQKAPALLCENNPVAQCLGLQVAGCKLKVQSAAEACGPRLLDAWPKSFEETPENAKLYSTQYRQCIYREWQRQGEVDALQLNLCQ